MTQNEKSKIRAKVIKCVTRLFLILVAIIMLYPLAWNVVSSFKTSTEFLTDPFAWPQGLAWDNYVRAYEKSNLAANIGNSIYVVLETLVIIVICVVPCSYCLVRYKFPGAKLILNIYMAAIFIQATYIMIPLFLQMNKLNLLNSLTALGVLYATMQFPFAIFLLTGFLRSIPRDYEEAAMIDGCGPFRILTSIIIPMCKPGIVTVCMISAMAAWNEYPVALVMVTDPTKATLPVGLANLYEIQRYATDWGALFAALVLQKFSQVKADNKKALADWLEHTQGVNVDPTAMFDIQSKRLHEYKRQQLNLLYLIHQYFEIRAGHTPAVPLVSIFGAKAAPAYIIAKDIIHALLTLSKVIAADPLVAPWLQVVFVENYNVTAAEKMIPACDLSEQISLASKEASGTGNMKFMLNGALTLGTMDGANVEISQQVGNENIYIFGQTSGQVIHRYAAGDYNPADWYEGDPNLRRAIDFLTGPEMLAAGKEENLARLQHELKTKDWFQTLPDFNAYVVRKGQALSDYACDPLGWRRKCLINISKAGFFSSDRTIAEYNSDIWHLGE